MEHTNHTPSKLLVSAEQLRQYFDPAPSLRTIREWQKVRRIPYIKIGKLVYFDPEVVRKHLETNNQITPRR